jgi:hypothetical protein
MSSKGMESAIANYNRKRGILKTSVHLFRYAFATKWALAGRGKGKTSKDFTGILLQK